MWALKTTLLPLLPTRLATCTALLLVGLTFGECVAQTPKPSATAPAQTQRAYGLDPTTPLPARLQHTPANVLQLFQEAGLSPREHVLTAAERLIVATAFAELPPLHQRVLKAYLRSISFLDEMPNTALTSVLNPGAPYPLFHITIRAAILPQTVSEWLTEKERTCFETTNSPLTVSVEAGVLPALEYVLLHEATHVVDAALQLTPATLPATEQRTANALSKSSFTAGVWQARTLAVPLYRDTLLEKIRFRRDGKVLSIARAQAVYCALQRTPFVSLYGSSAWTEDLAEYVAVYHFTQKRKQPFRIIIRQQEQVVFTYEPMRSALVNRRRREIKRFYS